MNSSSSNDAADAPGPGEKGHRSPSGSQEAPLDSVDHPVRSSELDWTNPGVDLTLDTALRRLRKGKEPFGAADRATIAAVVEAMGNPREWDVDVRDGFVGEMWADRIHIHPTMIVTSVQVPGATRTDTYPHWPWRVELTGWTDRSERRYDRDRTTAKFCQLCMNPLDDRHDDGCY